MAATSGAIRAGRAFVEIFTDDSKLARGLTAAQNRLNAFGTNVGNIGRKLAALGAAALAPVALSTKTFAGFDAEMSRVQALTGATAAQMAALRDQAKQLGATTVFTAADAARAMSFFALAGYDVQKIMAAMGPTLNLAAAGQMDVAQAADIAAKIMAGSGVEAKNLGYAIDVLVKAMTTANTDLPMLGDAMKYVGPVAKTAGVAFEETVAAIQLLSDSGIQADMAGTTLRGALLALTDPSKEAREELAALGVEVLDDAGKIRKLADIVDDFNRGLAGKGGGERLGIIGRVFDARQAAGFAELLNKGGDLLRQRTGALGSSLGTGSRIAATQLDNLKGDATILTSALEGLRIEVGEAVAPALRGLTQDATGLTNALIRLAQEQPELIVNFTKGAAVAVALGGSLLVASQVVRLASTGIGLLRLPLMAGSVAMSTFTVAGNLATASIAALNAIVALGPAGIVAFAGGIALLSGDLVEFESLTGETTSAISSIWSQTMREMLSDGRTAIAGIVAAMKNGDIEGAMEIAGLGLRLEWERILRAMHMSWIQFVNRIDEFEWENNPLLSDEDVAKKYEFQRKRNAVTLSGYDGMIKELQGMLKQSAVNATGGGWFDVAGPIKAIGDAVTKGVDASTKAVQSGQHDLDVYKARRPNESTEDWRKRQQTPLGGVAAAKQAELDAFKAQAPHYLRPHLNSYEDMLYYKNDEASQQAAFRRGSIPSSAAGDLNALRSGFTNRPDTTQAWKDLLQPAAASIAAGWKSIANSPAVAGAKKLGGGLFDLAGGGVSSIADALGGSLSKVADQVSAAVKNTSKEIATGGTFNGLYAAQQLGVGDLQKQVAANTKTAADTLKRIERQKSGMRAT